MSIKGLDGTIKRRKIMTTVKVMRRYNGTYRIQTGIIILQDNLTKAKVIDAIEQLAYEYALAGTEYKFEFEF